MSPASKQGLISEFSKLYPDPKSELDFKNPYQLIVSVALSAQCTDKKVNQTTPSLFEKYPDFGVLAKAKLKDVEEILRPVNYYRTKSKNIIAMAKLVLSEFGGALPKTHEELTTLPGVGQKTANVVLGEMGISQTFPVDTHVFRVSQRLGLAKGKTPGEIEDQLTQEFDPDLWRNLHHWLIFHGRRVCKAQNPLCESCTLIKLCPSAKLFRK